jgi:hypothetical protein
MQKDRKPPAADAILRWIPACAGMTEGRGKTSRIWQLAKVLHNFFGPV